MNLSEEELQIMKQARDLLLDKNRWSTRQLALDDLGKPCEPTDPSACKWCAEGAIRKFSSENDAELLLTKINNTLKLSLFRVNDVDGREAVIDLFNNILERNDIKGD